ncbi:hypothetical protein AL486_19155 [Pandoraea apista]|uniref:hypothetical protein n=1 Tax=Pandoraea apista TaxID=93218 RepID=UPI000CE95AF7|nr:hypothetical protein [Pandoraea apista]AVF41573.1 hypothetical protein AL486_19155 [Pandoraea apista]
MKTAKSGEYPDGDKLSDLHFVQLTIGELMDFSALVSAVSGAKTAVELVKTAISARDQTKAEEAITDAKRSLSAAYDSLLSVTQQSLDLVQQLSAAQDRIQALEKEKKHLESELEERNRYALADVGGGILAYTLKPGDESGEPHHSLCQPCMTKGHKSVLQPQGNRGSLKCFACGTMYVTDENARRPQVSFI